MAVAVAMATTFGAIVSSRLLPDRTDGVRCWYVVLPGYDGPIPVGLATEADLSMALADGWNYNLDTGHHLTAVADGSE